MLYKYAHRKATIPSMNDGTLAGSCPGKRSARGGRWLVFLEAGRLLVEPWWITVAVARPGQRSKL